VSTTPTTTSAKPRLRVLGPGRYLVESTSRPGIGHQVDVLRLRCGCEAGRHGRRCRHVVLAIQYDEWRRRQSHQDRGQRDPDDSGHRRLVAPNCNDGFLREGPVHEDWRDD
jgi:hypothetical protein